MKTLRSYHWAITGALFLVAALLYITGFGKNAAALVVLGFVVETIAWVSIALHPDQQAGANSMQ